jgi:hypothetical protein
VSRRPKTSRDTRQRKATRKFFVWFNRVRADRALLPTDALIAFDIGQHFNHKRGNFAWPSYLALARNTGAGKATVIRAVSRLRERGHLIVEPGHAGRGHPNKYRMGKGPPVDLLTTVKRSTRAPKRSTAVDLNYLEPPMGTANAVPHGREKRSLALASPPGARSPVGGAPVQVKQEVTAPDDRFPELLEVWDRGFLDDEAAARRAFAAACREAEPDTIIAAAREWAAAFDAPRFLPKLEKWLAARGWTKQPPSRRPQRNRGKPSLFKTAIEYAQRRGGHS